MYSGPNHFLFYKVCTNFFSKIDPEIERKKNSCAFEKKLIDKDEKCFPNEGTRLIVELVKDTSVGKTGDDEKNIFSEK